MKQLIPRLAGILLLLTFSMTAFSQATIFKGRVVDGDGNYVEDAKVINASNGRKVLTDAKGEFYIEAAAGDRLQISWKNIIPYGFQIPSGTFAALTDIPFNGRPESAKLGALSAESYWVGAKVGYNFDGFPEDGTESFIGSAKVMLNALKPSRDFESNGELRKYSLGVVGNISDFISSQNKEDATKNLQNIALSVQGFGLGFYGSWVLNKKSGGDKWVTENPDPMFVTRLYGTTGYRLNTFKNVGADSVTVNLSQLRTSIGFEIEGGYFSKGGRMNLSTELTYSVFDKSRYKQVFNDEKSGLLSLEINAILPVTEVFGLYASGTFAPDMKAVYQIGVIVRQTK